MSLNHLIYRNLKKNIKNYYLYVFALIFCVALYFSFVTLQFDPSMDDTKGSIKGAAAIKAASVLLIAIVTIFLLYANNLFIKRRSKEIGLFQLIGLRKGKIFQILSAENLFLYYGSLVIGIFIGFSVSKFILLILIKMTGVEATATLRFSTGAMLQTLLVFTIIYFFIMITNFIFIKRQSILSLFRVTSSTEEKIKKPSLWQNIIGVIGIGLILLGYYLSTKLFIGDYTSINALFIAMISILASVIIGTYLFYKGSVSFIFHMIRKQKDGYVNINDVLSLSSIMFRMKSNSFLLTVITTLSALAIGLLSLTYISYYSAEKTAEEYVPNDFSILDMEDAQQFITALEAEHIAYNEIRRDVLQVDTDLSQLVDAKFDAGEFGLDVTALSVVSEQSVKGVDLAANEAIFTGYSKMLDKIIPLKDTGEIKFIGNSKTIEANSLGVKDGSILPLYFTNGGLPAAVVDHSTFEQLAKDMNPDIQKATSVYIGIDIDKNSDLKKANEIFLKLDLYEDTPYESRLERSIQQKQLMGLTMFTVGFLGLTFLITSGCILYFKQMDESEEERPNYTILRKLGFTQDNLLRGIQVKQLFNFGIPLMIGLCHSYFAVKSGWFFFGTELWTPMIIVMLLYTGLYSIFGILSVLYYKKVIKEAL